MFGEFDLLCTLSGCYTLLFSFGMCNFVFIFNKYNFNEKKVTTKKMHKDKIKLPFTPLSLTLAFEDYFFFHSI